MGYWNDFGGLRALQRWCLEDTETWGAGAIAWDAAQSGNDLCPAFYSSSPCRELYLTHARLLLERVNTLTGVAYSQDPPNRRWAGRPAPGAAT